MAYAEASVSSIVMIRDPLANKVYYRSSLGYTVLLIHFFLLSPAGSVTGHVDAVAQLLIVIEFELQVHV